MIKTLYHRAYKICSKELLDSEVDNIRDILIKNGYPVDLIKRVIKSQHNNLNKPKIFGPEKFPAVLKLPYIGEASRRFEVKVKELIKENYNQISPRIIFLSKPVIKVQLKDPIPIQIKVVLYTSLIAFATKAISVRHRDT